MQQLSFQRARLSAPTVATLLSVLGSGILVVVVLQGPSEYRLPLACYALFLVAVLSTPFEHTPALLLAACVLVPTKYLLPNELLAGTFSPALLGATAFLVRASVRRSSVRLLDRPPVVLASCIAAWLLLCSAASVNRSTSLAWSLSFFVLAVALGVALREAPETVRPLSRTWLALGVFIAVFGAIERYLFHDNPIFRDVFEHPSNGRPILQEWSVYRATTTLGHPLVNGLFLATALPFAAARFRVRRTVATGCAIPILLLGLAATGSRGSLAAGIIGSCVALAVSRVDASRIHRVSFIRVLLACAVGLALAVLLGSTLLASRSQSSEGAVSAAYRKDAFDTGTALLRAHPLAGSGPGTAIIVARQAQGKIRTTEVGGALENSWLELAVAISPIGLALVLLLCSEALRRSIAANQGAIAGALVSYIVAAAGFNFLESQRPLHLLLGLLVGSALSTTMPRRQPLNESSEARS